MKDKLPQNAIQAQGMLVKAFYERYGDEVLPTVDRVMGLQGHALGLKVKRKLIDSNLSTLGAAFAENFDPATITVITLTDHKFHMRGNKCPFGLEDTSRQLCEAVMAIDREYFLAASDGKARLEIVKTKAGGDRICEIICTIS